MTNEDKRALVDAIAEAMARTWNAGVEARINVIAEGVKRALADVTDETFEKIQRKPDLFFDRG